MRKTCSVACLDTLHVHGEAICALLGLGKEMKERLCCICCNIKGRFIFLRSASPLCCCVRHRGSCWHRIFRHKGGPVRKGRIFYEGRRDSVVGDTVNDRLAKEVAGYGHTDDTSQLEFRHSRSFGQIRVENGAI